MTAIMQRFISAVLQIKAEKPVYRQPGKAADGTCDCIGMIIGALERIGIKWKGIHGSNYAVRRASYGFKKITSTNDLEVGMMVFKAYEQGDSKNTLPARYKPGGEYCNGDYRDYYHVGVVTSVSPLEITHMTSPTVKTDTKLGKWQYASEILHLHTRNAYNETASAPVQDNNTATTPVAQEVPSAPATVSPDPGVKTAVVTAESGRTVKMRRKPSRSCNVYDDVPIGATVTLVEYGGEWSKISYKKRTGWYMMTKFLKV